MPQICRAGVACHRVRLGIDQVPEEDFMIDVFVSSLMLATTAYLLW